MLQPKTETAQSGHVRDFLAMAGHVPGLPQKSIRTRASGLENILSIYHSILYFGDDQQ